MFQHRTMRYESMTNFLLMTFIKDSLLMASTMSPESVVRLKANTCQYCVNY